MQFPEIEYGIPIRYAILPDGNRIAYHECGKGSMTLLFVHGLASNLLAWIKLIPLLSDKYHCVAIDLPGYGKSSSGVHSGTQDFYAEIIHAFISTLSIKDVIGVGHSMGGQIIASTALRFPSLFKRVILLASAGIEQFTPDEITWIKETQPAYSFEHANDVQIKNAYEQNFYQVPEDLDIMMHDRFSMRSWQNFRLYCQVIENSLFGLLADNPFYTENKIFIPVTILFGANDRLIPHPILHPNLQIESILDRLAKTQPNLSFRIIPECGHFIPWEKTKIVAAFLI